MKRQWRNVWSLLLAVGLCSQFGWKVMFAVALTWALGWHAGAIWEIDEQRRDLDRR